MLIQVEDENTEVYSEPDTESQVVGQAEAGDTYDVLEMVDGQWAKISTGEFEGYLNTAAAEDEEETLEDAPEEAPGGSCGDCGGDRSPCFCRTTPGCCGIRSSVCGKPLCIRRDQSQ